MTNAVTGRWSLFGLVVLVMACASGDNCEAYGANGECRRGGQSGTEGDSLNACSQDETRQPELDCGTRYSRQESQSN